MKRLLACALALPLLAAAAPTANAIRAGETVYARCLGCHALAYDRTGPRHCGLFGRRAGGVPGFQYSEAMKAADIVWTARTLDRFLENPARAVPGTTMGYAGVADRSERSALIAYLENANASAECRSLALPGKQAR
jgi:cytochrome c